MIKHNGYPIEPASFYGIFTLILLCSFACCILCTSLAVDKLSPIKKIECGHQQSPYSPKLSNNFLKHNNQIKKQHKVFSCHKQHKQLSFTIFQFVNNSLQ